MSTKTGIAATIAAIILLLLPDGVAPGPKPDSSDQVAVAFDTYETLWRAAQGALADRLEAGDIQTEAAATEWFTEANKQARATAFKDLLDSEYEKFGGDKWSAKAQAETIRKYVK